MAYDSPKLGGYIFKHPPTINDVYWDTQLVTHELSDGSKAVYNKGFILKGKLGWGDGSWIDADDYSNVTVLYNQLTATAQYYPKPDTYASRKYNVQILNTFNFTPLGGRLESNQAYEGTIEFESSIGDISATAGSIF